MVCSGDTLCPRGVVPWLRFAQPDAAQINHVHVVLKKAQGEVMLNQGAVNLRGPVLAKLIQGFQDRKAGQSNAVCRSAILA
jgi:hypothetical protein